MKKITLLCAFLLTSFSMLAQVFPEGFETGVPPTDWTSFRGTNGEGDVYDWTTSTSAASGSQAAYVRYESVANEAEDWLVTPQFTPTAAANILTFQQRQVFESSYGSVYTIRVSTASQTTHADFTIVDTQAEADFGTLYSAHYVDLSAYNDVPIYVAFVMTNDNGDNWYIDDVDLIADATAPDCASNPTPADGAVDVEILSNGNVAIAWDAPTTGDAAGSYEVFWGTTSGDLTFLGDLSATSVEISDISYSTTYYWMVVPRNSGGSTTGCAEWSFTTENIVPYLQTFDTYPPSLWTEAIGAYGAPSGTNSSFTGDDFVNDTSHPNGRSASVNIYGTDIYEYLISPEFNLSGVTYYLNFDIGLVEWNTTSSGTLGSDDYVALLVTEDNGANWTELTRWDATTAISNTGQRAQEIVLSGYGDTVQFAYYASSGSEEDNEDNDFFIDNFQITTTSLGSTNESIEGFKLYPTIVEQDLNFSALENVQRITIYNLLGQEVFKTTPNVSNASIDLSTLKGGIYMVKVQVGNTTGTYKIIKK